MTILRSTLAAAFAAIVLSSSAYASGAGENGKPGHHFEFAEPKTAAEAVESLRSHSADMVIALVEADPYAVHEMSYHLENATAVLERNGALSGEEKDRLNAAIEAVHVASEKDEIEPVRAAMPELLARIDHYLLASGATK